MDSKPIKDFKIAVVYSSKYGTTQQYAKWLSEALECDIFDVREVSAAKIDQYNCIIFGTALHAGGMRKISAILKMKPKKLIIFTVGLANPETTDYSKIISKNVPEVVQKDCKIFHLRGGIDYRKLSFVDRIMMAMMKRGIKKQADKQTAEEKLFLETYGQKIDFSDKRTLKPIVDYVMNEVK